MSDSESEPETTLGLAALSEALKGQTVLEKPRVKRRVLVGAVRAHNAVLGDLRGEVAAARERLQQLERETDVIKSSQRRLTEVTNGHTHQLADLSGRIQGFETLVDERVSALRSECHDVFATKDALVEALKPFEVEQVRLRDAFDSLSGQVQKSTEAVTKRLDSVEGELRRLPNELVLSAAQVIVPARNQMSLPEQPLTRALDDVHTAFEKVQQHGIAVDQQLDEHRMDLTKCGEQLQGLSADMADNLRELNDRMASFEAWRREQEEMDISDVRRKQDAIIEGITALQHDLVEKIDRADVDEKIEAKYQEIIDHLQTALESTHEDEDEFRRMTATLKTTVENLQTLKADRREVVELRRQVVLQQAQGGAGAGMSLAGGISRDELLMLLDDKMDKQEWDVQMEQLRQRLDSVNAEMGEIGYALKQMEGGKSNAKFARLGRRATISDPEGRAFVASSDQTWSGLAAALRNAAQSPGQSTANGTPFYPAAAMASDLSKLRPITVPGIASENAALATNVPIVNANKYGLNPRNAYGGGFQLNAHLLPPRAPHSPFPQGPDSHSPTYDRGPPLRSGNQQELREINVALPPSLKRLVKGTDGKFYRGELREPATASDSEDAMDDEDASHDSVASRREDP